jgi:hypothetical protein
MLYRLFPRPTRVAKARVAREVLSYEQEARVAREVLSIEQEARNELG